MSSHLRTPLTTFIGRDDAIDDITALLDTHRLVTLTGAGGCGKTRLAVEVASRVEGSFDDGATFVDLAPLDAPTAVASALASAVGVADSGGAPLIDLLVDSLAGRHLLLVIDNCERLASACADVLHPLLASCHRLIVLATSRTPIGVEGEVTWRVPSLSAAESEELLADRAQLARPGFTLSAADAPVAAAICRRLDGIPLAIELAASRVRGLDLTEVAKGLEDRFRLLSAGPRTAPPRQRTLEASIDWSYELLDPRERTLFRRLSVFAAGFNVDAVEEVCADEGLPATSVVDVLAGLVDQSLVTIQPTAETRYRLLETVREYARLRLTESGEEAAIRNHHLERIAALTGWFNQEADGPGLEAANRTMEPVIDDVRSAIAWSLRSGRCADGLGVAADLRLFWIATGRNQEGQAWLSELLDAAVGSDVDPRTRARALLAAGELTLYARDPRAQLRLASEALESARQLGDVLLEAWALVLVGWAKVDVDPIEARSLLDAGRVAASESGDQQLTEFALYGLGSAAAGMGEFATAQDALDRGIAIARASRTLDLQYGLGQRGYVELLEGRIGEAVTTLTEATGYSDGPFDRVHRDLAVTWLATAELYRGRYDEAMEAFEEALAIARSLGNQPVRPSLHMALAERALGHDAKAARRLESIRTMVPAIGPWFEAQALVCLGQATGATEHVRAAMALAERSGNPLARVVAGTAMASVSAADHDVTLARTQLRTALRTAEGCSYRIGAIDAMEALALASLDESAERAGQLLAAVDAERSRIGYVRFPVHRPAYEAAQAAATPPAEPLAFGEAAAVALRGESRAPRPVSGWQSLTPAEARVAVLVAEGLSNPQIGERLFISRRTVQTHISHVFTKLGVSTRAELAAVVSRSQPST